MAWADARLCELEPLDRGVPSVKETYKRIVREGWQINHGRGIGPVCGGAARDSEDDDAARLAAEDTEEPLATEIAEDEATAPGGGRGRVGPIGASGPPARARAGTPRATSPASAAGFSFSGGWGDRSRPRSSRREAWPPRRARTAGGRAGRAGPTTPQRGARRDARRARAGGSPAPRAAARSRPRGRAGSSRARAAWVGSRAGRNARRR